MTWSLEPGTWELIDSEGKTQFTLGEFNRRKRPPCPVCGDEIIVQAIPTPDATGLDTVIPGNLECPPWPHTAGQPGAGVAPWRRGAEARIAPRAAGRSPSLQGSAPAGRRACGSRPGRLALTDAEPAPAHATGR
jgi:hypothetical protein